eukprot:1579796-Pleurochrysis_carterae.AAC.1
MRLRAARQAKYALVLSARRNGASAASMSSLKRWRIASLKRGAILDAGCVPKPSLRSDTKNNVFTCESACAAGVRSTSDCWMKT